VYPNASWNCRACSPMLFRVAESIIGRFTVPEQAPNQCSWKFDLLPEGVESDLEWWGDYSNVLQH
jgi:hypothetical protein